MSVLIESKFIEQLTADPVWQSLITGGTYSAQVLGRMGIVYTNPVLASGGAFDGATLKPIAFVRTLREEPFPGVRDEVFQAMSTARLVEVYLYQDSGIDIIETALKEAYRIFHDKQFDWGRVMFAGGVGARSSEELSGVFFAVVRFVVYTVRLSS